ncbi:MAG: hypothetical protein KKG59_04450 [Nanoarchaeota archaeon]|nr:hypothetical protein [Nanoarchaeota archaeon]
MKAKKKKRLIIIYAFTLVFIFIFFFIPLPYYSLFPGELINLGEIVTTSNNDSSEHFFSLTSNVYENPYSHRVGLTANSFKVNLIVFIIGKISREVELVEIPKSYENISSNQIKEYQYNLLNESLLISMQLAFEYLKVNESEVDIAFGEYAGSSGSLMLALEIINQLGDEDLIMGRKIAGTGDLNITGEVIEVGGIHQKIITAEKNKVDIMIIPEPDLDEVPDDTEIQIIVVTNLTQAIYLLTK